MGSALLSSLLGWAAFLSAAATIGTAITGILFFVLGGRFGPINDAVSVLQMLVMLPVAAGLYLVIRRSDPGLALVATVPGVLGMLVAALLQALLVVRVVQYEQTIGAVLAAGGGIGLWLVLANILALVGSALPVGLAICGIVAGVGYVLLAVGFRIGGQEHPLSYAGAGAMLVGYTVWAIWLGYLFASGALAG